MSSGRDMKKLFIRMMFKIQLLYLKYFYKDPEEVDFIYEIEEKYEKHRSEKEKQNDK